MLQHYANRPYCNDVVTIEGKMDIEFGWLVKMLSPFLRFFGALVPYQGHDIDVTVHFKSDLESRAFWLDRMFYFKNKKPFRFRSFIIQIGEDDVVEFIKFGIGARWRYYWNGKKVVLQHKGYVWKLLGIMIPIPIGLLPGKGYAEEEALSDCGFRLRMIITHFLFGQVYEYKGQFTVINVV